MSYSKQRIEIGNAYRDMLNRGIHFDEASFITWAQYLYEVDYATAKNGLDDGKNLIAMQQQAELSQQVDEDKALDNIVENLDNKLSENEEKILEVFKENEQ